MQGKNYIYIYVRLLKKAQLDNFADKFDELIQFLKATKFL